MASPGDDDGFRGVGEAADGLVKAFVADDGLLEGLSIGARAMRLAPEVMARHVVTAIRQAQEDRRGQLAEKKAEEEAKAVALAEALDARLDEFESRHDREFPQITTALYETVRKLEG